MPKAMEEALKRQAEKLAARGGLRGKPGESMKDKKDRYIYGGLAKFKKKHGMMK
jgi:hypothetical protein